LPRHPTFNILPLFDRLVDCLPNIGLFSDDSLEKAEPTEGADREDSLEPPAPSTAETQSTDTQNDMPAKVA